MSAISKLYGTQEQYMDLYSWLLQSKRSKYILSMYPKDEFEIDKPRTIASFNKEEDMDLLENCPLPWVTKQIKEQYNIDNISFDQYKEWVDKDVNPERILKNLKPLSFPELLECWNIIEDFHNKFYN